MNLPNVGVSVFNSYGNVREEASLRRFTQEARRKREVTQTSGVLLFLQDIGDDSDNILIHPRGLWGNRGLDLFDIVR